MTRRVVMADVAKLAKVSSQTVSRVLSGKGAVSSETERRVRNAIDYLGYQPYIAAQMLASGTSRSIGVLTIGQLSYGRMLTFTAFERVARAQGHFVIPATATSYALSELLEAISYFRQAQVRSLLIIGQRLDLIQELIPHITVPTVVAINTDLDADNVSVVKMDQTNIALTLLSHIYDVGAREVAFIGPAKPDVDAMLRRGAFLTFCEKHSMEPHVIDASGWGAADGAQAAQQLSAEKHFDAVFAANDYIAIGCSAYLREHAHLVPGQDYALAGFDDIETAAFQYPGLTTVRQPFISYADAIFEQMQHLLSTEVAESQIISAEVVVRGSTSFFRNAKK